MQKMAKLPRTTKKSSYDKRFKVTQMIEKEKHATEQDLRIWQVACLSCFTAMTLAAISFFAK